MRSPLPRTHSGRLALVLVVVAVAAAFAACTLNPQPLPPGDDSERGQATGGADASTRLDAGTTGPLNPPPSTSDAGANADHEGGADGGDAGDAGDGGDAG